MILCAMMLKPPLFEICATVLLRTVCRVCGFGLIISNVILGNDIGVVSPYAYQLKIVRNLLRSPMTAEIEVSTIDKYQGRDKECIIMSFVRSNEEHSVGELLTDWRRMNVAMTRARSKFIMIGSAATLRVCACTSAQTHLYQSVPFLKDLLDYIDRQGWLIRLPSGLDWRIHSRLE